MHFGSTFLSQLRMMLVGVWLGLYWVLCSFFDHYIQIQSSVQFKPHCELPPAPCGRRPSSQSSAGSSTPSPTPTNTKLAAKG